MTCSACPHIVKGSLAAVPGVSQVLISFKDKTATVTYDDAKAAIPCSSAPQRTRDIPPRGLVMSGRRSLIKGYFWRCAGGGCGHVFGLLLRENRIRWP